ncbi:hypothetical protein R4M03_06455 [Brachyspira pilosicoli]|uniref:Lipoprotein n=1 Tax=Brachyspira pilosicoli TaxID=52584 RepID=A0AAJ6GID3_BRAPL|nr:hypothetical protein [Brachyspira pilosicoli]WIH91189.1 hypothetical protein NEI02_04310 [Brachyspira pilosicoli]WIH93480.1 hypothetical protein NEI01_04310 [Brachyspira pilosicoli]WIH95770.1 hypothetical protein NEH99_04305 [Brachyspira pilosicoli]
MNKLLIISLLFVFIISCEKKIVYESKQYTGNMTNNIYTNDIDVRSRKFDAIGLIKKSSFTMYPDIKIEDLITSFNTVEWEDFIAEDDYMRYVDIIGTIDTNKYIFQFKILDHYNWELYAFEMNNKAYTTDRASYRLYSLYTNRIVETNSVINTNL